MHHESSPSTNGHRRIDGTFGPGHGFSRGHKGNRKVAELRGALLDAVDGEALGRVVRKLLALAEGGDVAAIKLLLEYSIGRPATQVELSGPDGGPLGGDWDALRGALLTALEPYGEARIAVALALRKIAADARTEDEEQG